MNNDQIDIFDLIEEVAEKKDALNVVSFLKQIVHEQSESNWKRIDAYEKEYDKIFKQTYNEKKSNQKKDKIKEEFDVVEEGVYSSE